MIKAREVGGNRITWADIKRYGYHPFAGSIDILIPDILIPRTVIYLLT